MNTRSGTFTVAGQARVRAAEITIGDRGRRVIGARGFYVALRGRC